ncbi:Short-chain dehydrogenase/reductase phqE [Pseudocercospora fuligena]|uniref:Short-chain dehydrogenase/reductase phqE n=1 Tax=Pseudocercospora fuligena TaxID=685502 RepID=A0A8H6RAG3_9PEZI|nr:Short-chain dehydrogenase/reductase phqE [Pseudocercospora fuligena]
MSLPVKAHPNTLASSRILIVGGTSGIGAAVVSGALANGGNVHISSSNPERIAARIAEFKALYRGNSCTITGTAADLSEEDTLEKNVKHVLDEAIKALGGPIDHLIYTAGDGYEGKPLSDLDPKTYLKGWNVRYLGPLIFAKIICANPGTYLAVDASSSITLTSGGLAHKPIPGVAHFIGWAGAIEALARGLAVDMAPVRVNVVSPGAIYTEMLATLGNAAVQRFGEATLTKRVGAASECAEAYLFCMRSAFFTCEVVKVDGGILYA